MKLGPGVKLIKLLSLSLIVGHTRLECLSLASFFQAASLKFVGKASSSTFRVRFHIDVQYFSQILCLTEKLNRDKHSLLILFNLWCLTLTLGPNISLACLSSLFPCLQVLNSRVSSWACPQNVKLGWKGLPGSNSSLSQTFVKHNHKMF